MNFKITTREIIASISIIAILLMIGFAISGRISEKRLDTLQQYNTALKIEDTDLFLNMQWILMQETLLCMET